MSLKTSASIFLGLSTSAVTPLAFSKPEEADLKERQFELKNCTLSNWGSSSAQLFKCQQEDKVWAFYLSSAWNQWFYGSAGRARKGHQKVTGKNQNDLTNVILTLEKGHKKIVVTGQNLNKELQVIWLESEKKDRRVFGYAPDSINMRVVGGENQGQSIKQQMLSNLESIKPEISSAPTK